MTMHQPEDLQILWDSDRHLDYRREGRVGVLRVEAGTAEYTVQIHSMTRGRLQEQEVMMEM